MNRTELQYLIVDNKLKFILLICWAFVNSILFALAGPLLLKYVTDEGTKTISFSFFAILGLVSTVFFVIVRISDYYLELYKRKVKNILIESNVMKICNVYYRTSYEDIVKRDAGYFVSRIYDDVKGAFDPAIELTVKLTRSAAMIIGGCIVVLLLSFQLTLVLAIVTFILIVLSRFFSKRIQKYADVEKEAEATFKSELTSSVEAHKAVTTLNLVALTNDHIGKSLRKMLINAFQRQKGAEKYIVISGILLSVAEMFVLLGGIYWISLGKLTFGGLLSYTNAYWYAANGIRQVITIVPELSQTLASVSRLIAFEKGVLNSIIIDARVSGESLDIELKNVSFAYDGKNIIENLNLYIENGEHYLITGANGSGKTTLCNIILRLIRPSNGLFLYEGKAVGLTEPITFPEISAEYIAREVDFDRFLKVIMEFNAEFLLSKKYSQMSLGQKKKFLIALILAKEADCYIFDEPFSNLDTDSRNIAINTIIKYCNQKTLLIIEHNLDDYKEYFREIKMESRSALLTLQ